MALINHKPTSPGRRAKVSVVNPDLHKGAPHAALLEKQSRTGGRNNAGRITTRHRGGGHKQHYRIVDFKRDKEGIPARVERIEYDPNRTAHIALLCYADGERRYIIAPKGISVGDQLMAGRDAPIKVGNSEHSLRKIGKAGAKRWLGIRPTVRGVVMNPVDHPHGGGEGRTSGGRHPVSPWGLPTKGYKTRNNKRTDQFIVRRRTK